MKKYNKLAASGKKVLPFNSNTLVPTSETTAPIHSPISRREDKQNYSIDPLYLDKGVYIKEGCNSFYLNLNNKRKYLKGFLGQGHSPALNSNVILHQNTKAVVYSFNKVNNLSPLLTKTEYLLKSVFRSIFSLISRPIYLIKHDKVIIRLFVYLSPKIDKYLDTSTIGTRANNYAPLPTGDVIGSSNFNIDRSVAGFSANINRIKRGKFLKFKSLRPNVIDILKSQIQYCGKQESSDLIAEAREGHSLLENKCFNNLRGAVALAIPSPISRREDKQKQGSLKQGWAPSFLFINKKDKGEDGKAFGSTLPCPASAGQPLATPTLSEGTHELINQSVSNKYPYVSLVSNFKYKLEKLCLVFEKIFNKKVEFEIIKAQLPFQDSNILAQVLGYNANNYKFRRMLKILIPRAVIKNPSKVFLRGPASPELQAYGHPYLATLIKNKDAVSPFNLQTGAEKELPATAIPLISGPQPLKKEQSISYLSGMNIKLAGRLMTQSIRPRFTVQSLQEGSLARVKVHYIEKSRFTGKNKRGAFSFTVTISHVFN